MAKTVKEAIAEKIEATNPIKKSKKRRGFRPWLVTPLVLLMGAIATFFVVRRFFNTHAK